MRRNPNRVTRVLSTMSLPFVPIDGRLLRRGGAFLLVGLVGVAAQTSIGSQAGALADVLQSTVAACHVLGMSLCTAACLPRSLLMAATVSLSWGGLHVLKELSEHPLLSSRLLAHSPEWLRAIWLVDDGGQFVLRDSFEPIEIAVPIAAAAAAMVLISHRSAEK